MAPCVKVEQKLACCEGISPTPKGGSPSGGHISPRHSRSSTAARSINCSTSLKVSVSQVKAAQNYHNHKFWLCGQLLCSPQGSGQGSWGMAVPNHWLEPLRLEPMVVTAGTPQQRSPRPGDTLDAALQRRCWQGDGGIAARLPQQLSCLALCWLLVLPEPSCLIPEPP